VKKFHFEMVWFCRFAMLSLPRGHEIWN